jgi:hypothetical protein
VSWPAIYEPARTGDVRRSACAGMFYLLNDIGPGDGGAGMGWWNSDGPECRKCHEPTAGCAECKGEGTVSLPLGRRDCSVCDGTGYLCEANGHGKYWH